MNTCDAASKQADTLLKVLVIRACVNGVCHVTCVGLGATTADPASIANANDSDDSDRSAGSSAAFAVGAAVAALCIGACGVDAACDQCNIFRVLLL